VQIRMVAGFVEVAETKGCLVAQGGFEPPLWVMSLVGNCKFNYFAAQMTTHEDA
jgi:hypothetical protein